jgi:serine/threonine-protein kinase
MDKIGTYQIVETLHQGAQPLYHATAGDGRPVALKATPVEKLTPEMRERFLREGETCRTLDHPNVIRVFDTGEADGMLYQAMELLDGSDLGKVLASGRTFTWEEKLSIMEQVCEGLQYAHEHDLVHRDIKPANLFLENSGRVKVLDFGMVRVAQSELTRAGSALGTLNYMSPEQIRGERCTAASDVFSAGIVFFQLATGRHPFSARDRSLPQIVSAIVFETPPKVSELCPDAPEGLEFILTKALEKDATKRFQNAGELKQALALCRVTLNIGGAPVELEPRTAPVEAAEAATPVLDGEKTKVMRRPVAAVAPTPAPAAPTPVRVPEKAPTPVARNQFRYCPTCTAPNPPDATICRQCGTPLAAKSAASEQSPKQGKQWALPVAVGVAVVLALILIVVLITR